MYLRGTVPRKSCAPLDPKPNLSASPLTNQGHAGPDGTFVGRHMKSYDAYPCSIVRVVSVPAGADLNAPGACLTQPKPLGMLGSWPRACPYPWTPAHEHIMCYEPLTQAKYLINDIKA